MWFRIEYWHRIVAQFLAIYLLFDRYSFKEEFMPEESKSQLSDICFKTYYSHCIILSCWRNIIHELIHCPICLTCLNTILHSCSECKKFKHDIFAITQYVTLTHTEHIFILWLFRSNIKKKNNFITKTIFTWNQILKNMVISCNCLMIKIIFFHASIFSETRA